MLTRRQILALGLGLPFLGCRSKSQMPSYYATNGIFAGDSIMAGNHTPGFEIPTLVGASLPTLTVHNVAVPSSSIDNAGQGATVDALYDGSKARNVLIFLFGANDLTSEDGTAYYNSAKTWAIARKTAHPSLLIVALTVLPNGGGTINPLRAVCNPLIAADLGIWYDALADIGNTATTMGADAAPSNPTLYNSGDLVHPTNFGNGLLEPTVTSAIASLITIPTVGGVSRSRMQLGM